MAGTRTLHPPKKIYISELMVGLCIFLILNLLALALMFLYLLLCVCVCAVRAWWTSLWLAMLFPTSGTGTGSALAWVTKALLCYCMNTYVLANIMYMQHTLYVHCSRISRNGLNCIWIVATRGHSFHKSEGFAEEPVYVFLYTHHFSPIIYFFSMISNTHMCCCCLCPQSCMVSINKHLSASWLWWSLCATARYLHITCEVLILVYTCKHRVGIW